MEVIGSNRLDYIGQRFILEGTYYPNYPAGVIGLSTGSLECVYPEQLTSVPYTYSSSPNSYHLIGFLGSMPICEITYNRFGGIATLLYE